MACKMKPQEWLGTAETLSHSLLSHLIKAVTQLIVNLHKGDWRFTRIFNRGGNKGGSENKA